MFSIFSVFSMFSTCSKLTPRAPSRDGRIEQLLHPCRLTGQNVIFDILEVLLPQDIAYVGTFKLSVFIFTWTQFNRNK